MIRLPVWGRGPLPCREGTPPRPTNQIAVAIIRRQDMEEGSHKELPHEEPHMVRVDTLSQALLILNTYRLHLLPLSLPPFSPSIPLSLPPSLSAVQKHRSGGFVQETLV